MKTMEKSEVRHIFLVGAKSLGTYGGYETFVNKLTEYQENNVGIKYHVACKANGDGCMNPYTTNGAEIISGYEFQYHNAHCFRIYVPQKLGAAGAIYYDILALKKCCSMIREQKIKNPGIYIMACRIGLFAIPFYKKFHRLGGKVFLNPDGHEWMRRKWSLPVRRYWKISEQIMVKYCDAVICDSQNIEKYIHERYDEKGIKGRNPKTIFIPYGAETRKSEMADDDPKLLNWYRVNGLKVKGYYIAVGRFVPENNYEIMIREFMKSQSQKDFVIITEVNEKFFNILEKKLHFKKDSRIKFTGTVYDQEFLMKIRENAYGYFHGHEVGGTNPSLLEALGSTDLNLILDVKFNKEVAEDAAVYWHKKEGSLKSLIDEADRFGQDQITELGRKAKKRIRDAYSWPYISERYTEVFLSHDI